MKRCEMLKWPLLLSPRPGHGNRPERQRKMRCAMAWTRTEKPRSSRTVSQVAHSAYRKLSDKDESIKRCRPGGGCDVVTGFAVSLDGMKRCFPEDR